jgi:hypothetical protein
MILWRKLFKRTPKAPEAPDAPADWVQLGRTEQARGRMLAAEIAYRNACALGALDALPHLHAVLGHPDAAWSDAVTAWWRAPDPDPMTTPVRINDARDAIELLCDRGEMPDEELAALMRFPTRRDMLTHILRGAECRHYHADLFRYWAETGGGA